MTNTPCCTFCVLEDFVQQGRTFNFVKKHLGWNKLWDLTREASLWNELIISWESCELWKRCKKDWSGGAVWGNHWEILKAFLVMSWNVGTWDVTILTPRFTMRLRPTMWRWFEFCWRISVLLMFWLLLLLLLLSTLRRMFCTVPHWVPASSGIELSETFSYIQLLWKVF